MIASLAMRVHRYGEVTISVRQMFETPRVLTVYFTMNLSDTCPESALYKRMLWAFSGLIVKIGDKV